MPHALTIRVGDGRHWCVCPGGPAWCAACGHRARRRPDPAL